MGSLRFVKRNKTRQAKPRAYSLQRFWRTVKLFRSRHVLFRKRSEMTFQHKKQLNELTSLLPTLVMLRKFTKGLMI